MTLLNWLCCRAKKNDSMSKAAIYRSVEADRPTLVLDEVSWVLDLKDERQNILCGGFERLGHAEVCEGESANITVRRYSTYCPKAFGLIGKLTATLMDRSIEIQMQRKLGEKVERLRRRDNDDHKALRQKCRRWAEDNRAALPTIVPKQPPGLHDRAFDAWEPLLTVAELAGGDWLARATEAATGLSGGEPAAEEGGVELLSDIKKVFDQHGMGAITTKTLIKWLCVDEERPWATYNYKAANKDNKAITDRQLATLLKPFEIISENVQSSETGEPQAKGYRLVRFEDAFERYLTAPDVAPCQEGGLGASKRPNADETGTTSDFCVCPDPDLDGCKNSEKPANHGHLDVRTDKNPLPDHVHASGQGNGGNGTTKFRSDIEDAHEELRLQGQAEDDLTIPPFLDRRRAICDHCGEPGGRQWDYDHAAVRLHDHCEQPWIAAYRARNRRAPTTTAESSL